MNKHLRSALYILAFAVILAGALVFVWSGSARAQGPTPTDDQVNAVAKQLYCPVCENTPLDVCPTEACRQWRELIRKQLGEGWTEDQIKQYFVANYGARVLDEPPRTGLNWLVYVLPPVLILAGAFVLLRAMRAWTKASTAKAPSSEEAAPPEQDEYVARLEKELRDRK
ncbi:MAG: cytochrome c-type biogenesis protein CcmH [Bacteroidota bacterium]